MPKFMPWIISISISLACTISNICPSLIVRPLDPFPLFLFSSFPLFLLSSSPFYHKQLFDEHLYSKNLRDMTSKFKCDWQPLHKELGSVVLQILTLYCSIVHVTSSGQWAVSLYVWAVSLHGQSTGGRLGSPWALLPTWWTWVLRWQ